MKTYLTVYLGSAILVFLITPIVIRIARRINAVDTHNVRKVHTRSVPRIGGVAIFISAIALIVPVLFLPNIIGNSLRFVQSKIIALLFAGGLIFLTGLVDDIKRVPAVFKLLAQFAAAMIVCSAGIQINYVVLTDSVTVNFGWLSWPLTILWIIGITNAVNLVDGLDGLAAGICVVACGVIAVFSLYFALPVMTIIMLALLGALSGFLFFNFNPAKIFMGDCGSLFLGFTIASSSVLCAAKTPTMVGLALPVLALGIPIFDTLLSMLRRFIEGRSIFSPDRSHFHHRLLALGLCHRHAVITAYTITLCAAGLGMFMLFTRNGQTIFVFVCILFLLILVFRAVGSVRLTETMAGLKHKYDLSRHKKREMQICEEVELHFRQITSFDQWWNTVCLGAAKMNFVKGSLSLTRRDGTQLTLGWDKKDDTAAPDDLVEVIVPVRDRRAGPPLRMGIQICTNGSLESVGRRVTLFGRLIEEYSLATLPQGPPIREFENHDKSPGPQKRTPVPITT